MNNVVAISLSPVPTESWEEFLAEPLQRLRGDNGLGFAQEWSLWAEICIVVDGHDLLESHPAVCSLFAIVTNLPGAVERAERTGTSEWLVGHEGPTASLALSNDRTEVAVTISGYDPSSPSVEAVIPWRSWVRASRLVVGQARSVLKAQVTGEHAVIMEEWMNRWCPWWSDPLLEEVGQP